MAYTPEEIQEINTALKDYINKTDIPIVAEFAYQNSIRRQFLYENKILSDTIKTLIDKKEAQLERKGLNGEIDKTMAIFSLKQLGWKDRQEIDNNFNVEGESILEKLFKQLIKNNEVPKTNS